MTKRPAPPPGLLTPVLSEDMTDGVHRPSRAGELTWLRRPTEEPVPDEDTTGEVEVP